jgi:hypothetical protein
MIGDSTRHLGRRKRKQTPERRQQKEDYEAAPPLTEEGGKGESHCRGTGQNTEKAKSKESVSRQRNHHLEDKTEDQGHV